MSRPCRGVQGVVSQAQHRSCRRLPWPYRGHVAEHTRALLPAMSQHAAAVSSGMSRHTPTTKPLPSCHNTIFYIVTRFANQTTRLSRYKDCIVTQPPATKASLLSRYITLYSDTHPQPGPARTHCWPYRLLTVSQHCHGRIVACYAMSWRAPARPCALLLSLTCHNIVCCIVTQTKIK